MGGSKVDVKTQVSGTTRMTPLRMVMWAAIFIAVFISPIVFEAAGLLFMTRIMALVGLYIMLALGLNIVVGFAGLLDLGYIAFYAIGAYSGIIVGTAAVKVLPPALQPFQFFLMIPVAAGFAALTGILLGTPVLRLRGDYLAIVTLGFGEIVRIIINNNAFGLTNGAAGLPRAGQTLPDPALLGWLENHVMIQGIGQNAFATPFSNNLYWYYVIVLLVLITIFVVRRLDNSRLGRSWTALREDEVAASSMGISIVRTKLWAFSLGAVWGGIAGLTFANYQQFVSPESFTFMESVFVVATVVIGGMGSIPGAIIGALFIQGVPEFIRGFAQSGLIDIPATAVTAISNYRNLVFGLLMVVMMIWRPQGIFPSKRRAQELHPETDELGDEESETLYDVQHDTGTPGE